MNIKIENLECYGVCGKIDMLENLLTRGALDVWKTLGNYIQKEACYNAILEEFGVDEDDDNTLNLEDIVNFLWFDNNIYYKICVQLGSVPENLKCYLDDEDIEKLGGLNNGN